MLGDLGGDQFFGSLALPPACAMGHAAVGVGYPYAAMPHAYGAETLGADLCADGIQDITLSLRFLLSPSFLSNHPALSSVHAIPGYSVRGTVKNLADGTANHHLV